MTGSSPLPPPDPGREERELREYLGDEYRHERLQLYSHQLAQEFAQVGDEAAFYRSSQGYLYDLTAFAMTQTKEPYLRELVRAVGPPPARVLDFGCGIGSDGLRLAEAGYDVAFADFDNPSTRYLAWRLERRGLRARVYDVDRDEVPGGFDLAFAFDVIEHLEDPFGALAELERRAGLVVVNLLAAAPAQGSAHGHAREVADENPLHRELPVGPMVRRARSLGLRSYRVYHGRSHLLVYAPSKELGLGARAASWWQWARGRALQAAGRRF